MPIDDSNDLIAYQNYSISIEIKTDELSAMHEMIVKNFGQGNKARVPLLFRPTHAQQKQILGQWINERINLWQSPNIFVNNKQSLSICSNLIFFFFLSSFSSSAKLAFEHNDLFENITSVNKFLREKKTRSSCRDMKRRSIFGRRYDLVKQKKVVCNHPEN